jgi:hypothetical protein
VRNNDRLQEHTNLKTGKRYYTTTDVSGKHLLTVDIENAHLLRDVTWRVAPVRTGSTKLSARANSDAPRIKAGQLLHRLALRAKPTRRVRAIDGNLLLATKANLQSVSQSDAIILSKTRPADRWVGVEYSVPPKWMKTLCHYHARIKMEGKYLRLGSFKSAEEVGSCFDGAARRLYAHTGG